MRPNPGAGRMRRIGVACGGIRGRSGPKRNEFPGRQAGSLALARTVVLGCLAAAAGIWWLGRAYEVDNEAMLGYLLSSILFVALMAILGVAGATALWLVKRRRK